jgi:aspartate carbamoyltransferase catalytic subunit
MKIQKWYHQSVLSSEGWTREQIFSLLDLAQDFQNQVETGQKTNIGGSRLCLTLFYEPSTRTRLSFESAASRLGLSSLTVEDASKNSSSLKGETLEDTGRILSAYADVIIVRHPESGSAERLAKFAKVPVINAGDGSHEHPTQALVDLFTIRQAFHRFEGLRVGICGDLKNGRTVHSLLRLLVNLGCRVTLISPEELAMPSETLKALSASGNEIRSESNLNQVIPELDVLYMTRIQKERFESAAAYERVRTSYQLTLADLKDASQTLRILHPLPRVNEIAPEIDDDPRAFYFIQAANGVPVRMALLSAVLGLQKERI